ncbi:hypothetical protein TD95_000434 [Thielaviopsis punctulata]|uniref:Nibrin second BRCT domain-containing protein n=1 Tax=Thielaviopsis punctulata TaxID=72032 RepID=A0A0F4ZGU5_9PEZI|nr:hypothetical protein TD95_000434 [Thielaviopsis punctulata]
MGLSPETFRLTWNPVVLVYSLSAKSSQADSLISLRASLEQLDVKLIAEYHPQATHIVSKKRNTPKGLQALVNGKFIVTTSFVNAIVAAAEDHNGTSPLEQDFQGSWPQPVDHVPAKGNETIDRPADAFLPDSRRRSVFAGYTFVFYDETQCNTLKASIANGEGKVLLMAIQPQQTTVDEFVGFVKSAAGESGLGEFADGSSGPGVVVVRYIPASDNATGWYSHFITDVCVRLNHRAIEQSEFIEAILMADASILRRPLPAADGHSSADAASSMPTRPMEPTSSEPVLGSMQIGVAQTSQASIKLRARQRATKRFKGFDSDSDDNDASVPTSQWQSAVQPLAPSGFASFSEVLESAPATHRRPMNVDHDEDDSLFVPEGPGYSKSQQDSEAAKPAPPDRKRTYQALLDESLMDEIAPTAAEAKRRRIESGIELNPVKPKTETPTPPPPSENAPLARLRKQRKDVVDVLELARQARQKEDARLRREEEELAQLPQDLDMLAIRRNHVVQSMSVRQRDARVPHDSEELIAAGRWDPKWNGRRNFKKFRVRGEQRARMPVKTVVPLVQVRTKDFGLGDDYWLEDSRPATRREQEEGEKEGVAEERQTSVLNKGVVCSESGEEDDLAEIEDVRPAARRQTAAQKKQGALGKASEGPMVRKRGQSVVEEPPAKRARVTRQAITIPDSDSEEESRFQFGRRR